MSKKSNLTNRKQVRFSDDEVSYLEKEAQSHGLKFSTWVRLLACYGRENWKSKAPWPELKPGEFIRTK